MNSEDGDIPLGGANELFRAAETNLLGTDDVALTDLVQQFQHSENLSRDAALASSDFQQLILKVADRALRERAPLILKQELQSQGFILRSGKTAGQIWQENKLPALKNGAVWLGNRLVNAGCQISTFKAELGNRTARLFDPDKAADWLARGGRSEAVMYANERYGQTRLAFPKP